VVTMTRTWKPVPPTPFYLSKRAEWFRREAEKALLRGEKTNAHHLTMRAQEYSALAGELELGDTHAQTS
jgi:hypothetical protein